MFEIISLLLECRSAGTLPAELNGRIDETVRDMLKGVDALSAWQFENEGWPE